MPKLSDSMEEATILCWIKQPGDSFSRGEPLVEIETDKATILYEAETDGVLTEIVVPAGEKARLGEPIATIAGDSHNAAQITERGASAPPTTSALPATSPPPPPAGRLVALLRLPSPGGEQLSWASPCSI